MGQHEWLPERKGVLFLGFTDEGLVSTLITGEALIELLNPDLDDVGDNTAIETYIEFETDIHRIAHGEFGRQRGGGSPILITAAEVLI